MPQELGFSCSTAFVLLAASSFLGCRVPERSSPDHFTASGQLVALSGGDSGASNACFTCHGIDGEGNGAGSPRLAGLDIGYLNRQLESYANGTRRHSEMQSIARRLSARDRQTVSAYYAELPPTLPSLRTPAMSAPVLYTDGDPSRELLPCAACHGDAGQGIGPANPPLAGQPAPYLAAQLHAWRRSERRNDPAGVMLTISRRLTEAEVHSLAAYASSLRGVSSHRGSLGESRAGRRADPRNDASARQRYGVE